MPNEPRLTNKVRSVDSQPAHGAGASTSAATRAESATAHIPRRRARGRLDPNGICLLEQNKENKETMIVEDHMPDAGVWSQTTARKRSSDLISLPDEGPSSPKSRKIDDTKTGLCINTAAGDIKSKLCRTPNEPSDSSPQTDAKPDMSPDSDTTVVYGCDSLSPTGTDILRCFSPLPSTSRDNATFERNDQRFMASLTCDDDDDDVQIIHNPCVTIIIPDDDVPTVAPSSSVVVINDEPDDVLMSYSSIPNYGTTGAGDGNSSDCEEIVDIENIIAENAAFIQKLKMRQILETSEESISDTYTLLNLDAQQTDPSAGVPSTSNVQSTLAHEASTSSNEIIQSKGLDREKIANKISNLFAANSTLPSNTVPSTICGKNNTNATRGNGDWSSRLDINKRANGLQIVGHVDLSCMHNLASASAQTANAISQSQSSDCVVVAPNNPIVNATTPKKNQSAEPQTLEERTPKKLLAECPVCLESLAGKQVVCTLCGHVFCRPCILMLMRGPAYSKRCPTCRKIIKKNGYHPIFL